MHFVVTVFFASKILNMYKEESFNRKKRRSFSVEILKWYTVGTHTFKEDLIRNTDLKKNKLKRSGERRDIKPCMRHGEGFGDYRRKTSDCW